AGASARSGRLSPPSRWRGQRRRAPEEPARPPPGDRAGDRGRARPWPVAADLLLRVRRPASQAARDQSARGVAVAASRVFADGALEGRGAIVTGGGTNLGKAAAAELTRCGAQVVIAGRRAEVLEATAAELGERCSWVAGDIRERAGAEQ